VPIRDCEISPLNVCLRWSRDDAGAGDRVTTGRDFRVWEGVFPSFDAAPSVGPGFDGREAQTRGLHAARDAASQLAANEPLDYSLRQRNALLPTVVAMLLAGRNRIGVLDFGGGFGTGYMVLASAGGALTNRVEYQVVEVDGVCRLGRELFAGKQGPTFQSSLPDHGSFDVVHTASALQYIADWRSVVARLAGYGALYLVFADCFVGRFPSYVTLQNYYGSHIRHWFLNFQEFSDEVGRHGYTLALRLDCDARILGQYGPLPMDNFPQDLRLTHSAHLLFRKLESA
jgi:putative methyltransferase (TIGR04325 family)